MEALSPLNNRRQFLAQAGIAVLALAAPAAGAQEPPKPCVDPAALGLSQRNRRRSLGYVDVSNDPGKRCGGCAFFTAAVAGCGTCQLLSAGPVSAAGLCASYAAKAGSNRL